MKQARSSYQRGGGESIYFFSGSIKKEKNIYIYANNNMEPSKGHVIFFSSPNEGRIYKFLSLPPTFTFLDREEEKPGTPKAASNF